MSKGKVRAAAESSFLPVFELMEPRLLLSGGGSGTFSTDGGDIMRAYALQSDALLDGTGVKIGVISGGDEKWRTARDDGELPEITDLDEDGSAGDDGTAMMEIIHDLAPGASIYFYPAPGWNSESDAAHALAIQALVAAECDIIVDDIPGFDEPIFSDVVGDPALCAKAAVDAGVVFISAAGNDALAHYQAQFNGVNEGYHYFGAPNAHNDSYILPLKVQDFQNETSADVNVFLQWSDQWGSENPNYYNNYDLELYRWDAFGSQWVYEQTNGWGTDNQGDFYGGYPNPLEYTLFTLSNSVEYGVKVKGTDIADNREIALYARVNHTWLEAYFGENPTVSFESLPEQGTHSIFGHAGAEGVISVVAVEADSNHANIESFCSSGPMTLATVFAHGEGQAFSYLDPVIVGGIDGVETYSGTTDTTNQPYRPWITNDEGLFFGTGAAAAHVAAIVALWMQSDPTLTNAEITTLLTTTGTGIGTSPYDLVDALGPFTTTSSAPDAPVLTADYDTGVSNSDNYTSLDNSAAEKELVFHVTGTTDNARVFLYASGVEIGSAVAGGTSVNVTTNGTMQLAAGQYTITAKQAAPWELLSVASTGLTITIQADVSATPGTPVLTAASDTGIYDDDRLTKLDNHDSSTRLTFTVSGTVSGATVKLYLGQTEIGYAVATGTTTDVTTNGTADLSDGEHTITARQTEPVKFESLASSGVIITVDTVAPTVVGFARFYQGGDWDLHPTTLDTIVITFSADLYNAPVVGDLTLYNLSTSQAVSPDPGPDFSYDGQTNKATWDFDELDLTDNVGWYLVTISGEYLMDLTGNSMGSDYTYGAAYPQNKMLIPLLGDATLDGTVDGFDFTTLSLHWLCYGSWADGDFVNQSGQVPGDGVVDGFDFTALSLNWLESLSR